jgi:plastocyanin
MAYLSDRWALQLGRSGKERQMKMELRRRDLLKMAGVGTLVLIAPFGRTARGAESPAADQGGFTFLQISDTHIGFADASINPDYAGTLTKAVAAVNAMEAKPDFVIFTGDLSHTTDDAAERRKRLTQFNEIAGALEVKDVKFMPGEHDAALDNGDVWHDLFGKSVYTFEHKGVHFIVLDNVSDPRSQVGDEQLSWLSSDLAKLDNAARIVVFTHRPLFDLYPDWDWATRDGAKVLDVLMPYTNVTVFYGHIHQENHHMSGHIPLHGAKSLMFPLPAPGAAPKRAAVPWDPAQPYRNLGYRSIEAKSGAADCVLTEFAIPAPKETAKDEQVVKIQAKRYEYTPNEITVRKGVPVVLELTSLDRLHGFKCPDLSIRSDVEPGKVSIVRFVPDKVGSFEFFCDIYCGSGHENMRGKITVTE